jgi:hypothetical protein
MRLRSACVSLRALAVAVLVVSQPARASQLAYEGFGQTFPIYANGVLVSAVPGHRAVSTHLLRATS